MVQQLCRTLVHSYRMPLVAFNDVSPAKVPWWLDFSWEVAFRGRMSLGDIPQAIRACCATPKERAPAFLAAVSQPVSAVSNERCSKWRVGVWILALCLFNLLFSTHGFNVNVDANVRLPGHGNHCPLVAIMLLERARQTDCQDEEDGS